jgi:hypothetical protein
MRNRSWPRSRSTAISGLPRSRPEERPNLFGRRSGSRRCGQRCAATSLFRRAKVWGLRALPHGDVAAALGTARRIGLD